MKLRLEQRAAATFVTFGIFVATIVGFVGYVINERIEESIWRFTLDSELTFLLSRADKNPQSILIEDGRLRSYIQDLHSPTRNTIPKELRDLSPGLHDEYSIADRQYCVLVKDIDQKRYFIVYDITQLENEEHVLGIAALFSIIVVGAIVLFISVQLSRWILAPIHQLASQVSSLEPNRIEATLSSNYSDHEIILIANAIDTFLLRLQKFVEREQEFIGTASHELRTPIAVIAGATDVLDALPNVSPDIRKPLNRIKHSVHDMQETVDALLLLAKEEKQTDHTTERCAVHTTLEKVIESHSVLLKGKQVAIVTGAIEPTTVAAPSAMVTIALSNVIRNAIQFTDRGSITITLVNETFTVDDTGCGITADTLKQLFTSSDNSEYGKSDLPGFGIFLVKRLAHRFGWQVIAKSSPNKGTTIAIAFKPNK